MGRARAIEGELPALCLRFSTPCWSVRMPSSWFFVTVLMSDLRSRTPRTDGAFSSPSAER
jgi:hypothetical protein